MSALDQEVRGRQVGERLGDLVGGLEVAPADWSGVRLGVVRARRRRRALMAAKVAGGTLAVVALLGTFQVGVVPYPSWAPAVPVSRLDGGRSALTSMPTRGSSADDVEWLDLLRTRVAAEPRRESRGQVWQVDSADAVDVIYAGDVGGNRLALVEATFRWGLVEERRQTWFAGGAGANVADLTEVAGGQAGDVTFVTYGPSTGYRGAQGRDGILVVAPDDRPVTLVGPARLAADGSRELPRTVPARAVDGITQVPLPGSGEYVVEVQDASGSIAWVDPRVGDVDWSGRGTELAGPTLDQAGGDALSSLRLGSVPGTLVWNGGRGGPAVLVLEADSGARLVVMGHVVDGPPWRTPERSRADRVSFDVLQVRAAGTDDLAAWQLGETTWTQGEADPPRTRHTLSDSDEAWTGVDDPTSRIAVVGPADATGAELLDARGAVVAQIVLEDGGGSTSVTDAGAVSTARFLGPDGADLGTTPVVPWTPAGGAPQLSP